MTKHGILVKGQDLSVYCDFNSEATNWYNLCLFFLLLRQSGVGGGPRAWLSQSQDIPGSRMPQQGP